MRQAAFATSWLAGDRCKDGRVRGRNIPSHRSSGEARLNAGKCSSLGRKDAARFFGQLIGPIELIENGCMENARIQGEQLARGLGRLKEEFAFIGDARGLGLMQAIEIVKPRATKDTRNKALRDRILQEAYQRGLLLLGCGENSIRFCPPLIISREQVDGALSILDDCLRAV